MRRITIFEREGTWRFSAPGDIRSPEHANALDAAIAARDYGDTLRGQALGYVIRLQPATLEVDHAGYTLHTCVF